MQQRKMIFKCSNKPPAFMFCMAISFALSLMATASYAEVSVKNIEKNDKVLGSKLSSDKGLNDSSSTGEVADWVLKAEQWN